MTLQEARQHYRVEELPDNPVFRYEVFAPEHKNFGGIHSQLAFTLKEVAEAISDFDRFGFDDCAEDCDCRLTE